MRKFDFQPGGRVVFGAGALAQLGALARELVEIQLTVLHQKDTMLHYVGEVIKKVLIIWLNL